MIFRSVSDRFSCDAFIKQVQLQVFGSFRYLWRALIHKVWYLHNLIEQRFFTLSFIVVNNKASLYFLSPSRFSKTGSGRTIEDVSLLQFRLGNGQFMTSIFRLLVRGCLHTLNCRVCIRYRISDKKVDLKICSGVLPSGSRKNKFLHNVFDN